MRTSLRRALAGATATVLATAGLVVGAAAPAAAEDSTACPQESSTRLLTANDGAYKVWLYQPDPGVVYVCFGALSLARGVLVFQTGLYGDLVPTVVPDPDASECATYFHLQDPVDVRVQHEYSSFVRPARTYFCFGVNGTAVGVTVLGPDGSVQPDVDLWLDPYTLLCSVWYRDTCTIARRINIV